MKSNLHPGKFDHPQLAQDVLTDNPVLYDKINEHCRLEHAEAAVILTEVIRFLNLIAYTEKRLTPGKLIDEAWHQFILHTRAYWEFCEYHFGRMIHHHPGGTKEDNHSQFMQTLRLYQIHFGEPPARYWGRKASFISNANCGACEGNG